MSWAQCTRQHRSKAEFHVTSQTYYISMASSTVTLTGLLRQEKYLLHMGNHASRIRSCQITKNVHKMYENDGCQIITASTGVTVSYSYKIPNPQI